MRFRKCLDLLCAAIILAAVLHTARAAEPAGPIRAGIIGLDTSHVVEFTKVLNDPKAAGGLAEVKIVAAYPGGSPICQSAGTASKASPTSCAAWGSRSSTRLTSC